MSEAEFSLCQLQNWMLGMLVPHGPVVNRQNHGDLNVASIVKESQRLSAVKHLDIYRDSYIARLRACLQNQFGAVAYALGDGLFESFANQYLDAYPSESYTLNMLGERFADFLEEIRPDAGFEEKEIWPDFMIELAEFEYALSELFDDRTIENNVVPAFDTPDELLRLNPVFGLFRHHFPICRYYLDFTQDKKPELPLPEDSFCAVTRRHYKLNLFPIRSTQYYFLKIMQKGKSVEDAKKEFVKTFDFDRKEMEIIWPVWRKKFIEWGFLCV